MLIGGLDIGTTGCKLTVFDENGVHLGREYCDYPVKRVTGAHEVDGNSILDGVMTVIRKAAADYPEIAGIGVTSFGETFVATDENGTPLYPAMLYTDPRGREQLDRLCTKISPEKSAEISGVKPHEMYSLPKLMWLKENEPEIFERTKYVFLMEDLVVFRLTGQRKIDYSLATRTMGFDIRNLCWSKEIFDAAEIDPEMFSEPVPTGTSAGTITSEVAQDTGLSPDTQIVCVSHDQIAAAVGAGVFDSDTAVDGAGTVECITPVYDEIPDIEVMTRGNYAVVPYVIPGKYVCYAFSYTGGALMQWCTDTLAKRENEMARLEGISVNEFLEREYHVEHGEGSLDGQDSHNSGAAGTDEPSGLLVLPHFAGAATPYMDTGSRGVIVGLTTATTVADIYRGCMEGVVYEMVLNMEYLRDSGIHFGRLNATGGGARSEVWMQMKADMLDMEVTGLSTVDAGTVGSAMLTGIAIGCFDNLSEAASKMIHEIRTYYPDKEMHEKYMDIYKRYRELYSAVRGLM